MNMIIGKKQIILASLVVGLGLAVYVNYQFARTDGDLTATGALANDKNYGDAQLVDANDPTVDDIDGEAYFAEAKVTPPPLPRRVGRDPQEYDGQRGRRPGHQGGDGAQGHRDRKVDRDGGQD